MRANNGAKRRCEHRSKRTTERSGVVSGGGVSTGSNERRSTGANEQRCEAERRRCGHRSKRTTVRRISIALCSQCSRAPERSGSQKKKTFFFEQKQINQPHTPSPPPHLQIPHRHTLPTHPLRTGCAFHSPNIQKKRYQFALCRVRTCADILQRDLNPSP